MNSNVGTAGEKIWNRYHMEGILTWKGTLKVIIEWSDDPKHSFTERSSAAVDTPVKTRSNTDRDSGRVGMRTCCVK